MENLILIGGGGHCKSCIDVIEREGKYKIYGILDVPEKKGEKIFDCEIIGSDDDIEFYAKKDFYFLITVGQIKNADIRIKLFDKIKKANGKLATIISPDAYVSKHAKIEEGTIVMNNAIINAGVVLGKNCIINSKALIEHECIIKDNCHIAIGAVLAGGVTVEKGSFIGANATIVQGVTIPENSFIKAGTVVK